MDIQALTQYFLPVSYTHLDVYKRQVVTRYFGGTLLGTGGLVRAYSSAVQELSLIHI